MYAPRASGVPPQRPTQAANLPFKFRRKSFSDDDLPEHDVVPPSPSLSPSRSWSMSSSPPSSPTALTTSPARPSHLDTARILPPSSPTRPSAHHVYGYAYRHPRLVAHHPPYDQDLSPQEQLSIFPTSHKPHAYAIIPPPSTSSGRSSFSLPSPSESDALSAVSSSPSDAPITHDDDDDIEDYAFDLDDLLAGSSPSRRISFTTSSERDTPFVRPLPKPRAHSHRYPAAKFPASALAQPPVPVGSAKLRHTDREAECSRLSAPSPDIQLELPPAPSTPIRARTRTRSPSQSVAAGAPIPAPLDNTSGHAQFDDDLPPSSPIAPSPFSSPLSSPSRPSDSTVTVTGTDPAIAEANRVCPVTLASARDLSLPPSSPSRGPHTPPRDLAREAEMEEEFVASPPSPTIDALRITSRVAVRALLNPAPEPTRAYTPRPVVQMGFAVECEALPMDDVPVAEEDVPVVEVAEDRMEVEVAPDAAIAPLTLDLDMGGAGTEDAMVDIVCTDPAAEIDAVPAVDTDVEIPAAAPEPEQYQNSESEREHERQVEAVPELQSQSLPVSRIQSRASSRAWTPACLQAEDIPSSPLSSPPSPPCREVEPERDHLPIPDRVPSASCTRTPARELSPAVPSSPLSPAPSEHDSLDPDVDMDVDMRVAGPSRAVSPLSAPREEEVRMPPRKRARLVSEERAVSPSPIQPQKQSLQVHAKPVMKTKKTKRARTPTFTDTESEGEGEGSAQVVKSKDKSAGAKKTQASAITLPKPVKISSAKIKAKRPRAVLSDEEEADGDAERAREERRTGERKERERERERKRARTKAKQKDADDEDENASVHVKAHPNGKSANARPKPSAPKSATNIVRADGSRVLDDDAPDAAEVKRRTAKEKRKGKERDGVEDPLSAYDLPLPAAELEGMLIETLATARASSLATGALYGALMSARPALREMALPVLKSDREKEKEGEKEREREEGEPNQKETQGRGRGAKADAVGRRAWAGVIECVLEAGWRRCGVFGKVVNQGTDVADQELALEARWFYDPDRDEDRERAGVVSSMMRRPGKRSETKKAKQYYWRPLPKISRWDAEDEL